VTDVHVVSHTHWDREWYLTHEQFRLRLVDLVDGVLDLLDRAPAFAHFHLDGQTVVLEDYLELRPEQETRLRRRVAEGRLLVGPWYVMPDMFLVSGEALVRNLALGHAVAERFGGVMRVGYVPDPFGHVGQMPQLLLGFGLEAAILWRGFGGERAEYQWEAPDGSRVLLLHLPREGYGNAARLPVEEAALRARAEGLVAREAARSAVDTVLLMAGSDHLEPHPRLLDLLAAAGGPAARLSTLPAYAAAVAAAVRERGVVLPVVSGELRSGEEYAHLLPGVLSARVYLKQANARVQRTLERRAEPLAAFAWLAGHACPAGALGHAWKTLLQNHPHDSICGCSVDAVHRENETRFARAGDVADAVVERSLATLARLVPAAPAGALRLLVVNAEAAAHDGVVEGLVEVPVSSAEAGRDDEASLFDPPLAFHPPRPLGLADPHGRALPFQVLSDEAALQYRLSPHVPPLGVNVRRLRVAFRPPEVPPCGFAAVDLRFDRVEPPPGPAAWAGPGFLENDVLRADVKPDGTLDVREKRSGHLFERCAEWLDEGDVGDEYDHSPPAEDRPVASAQARVASVRVLHAGPLVACLEVDLELSVPAAASADRRTRSVEAVALPVTMRVGLAAASARLDLTVSLDNQARDHRLRLTFPTGEPASHARADTAFAVERRPARRPPAPPFAPEAAASAAPLQCFVDAGGEHAGLTLFTDGLTEYEVLEGSPTRLALTLLRCVGHLSRDDLSTRRGHAGPALPTPGAQCLGRHEFRLAIAPRGAPPPSGRLYAQALAFLCPPLLVPAAGAATGGPFRRSFLEVSCPSGEAVVSACKKADGRDSLVVRLFNPGAAGASVRLRCARPVTEAFRLDLRERRLATLPAAGGIVDLALGAGKIETVDLVVAWP
jgi:alpha-mannosidase